jgi:hypothetical protein
VHKFNPEVWKKSEKPYAAKEPVTAGPRIPDPAQPGMEIGREALPEAYPRTGIHGTRP